MAGELDEKGLLQQIEDLLEDMLKKLASMANDAARLAFFTGTVLPLLKVLRPLASLIPKVGPVIEKTVGIIEKTYPSLWNFNDAGFESTAALSKSELSDWDKAHLFSAAQLTALTVVGLALGMPALGAIGFAASAWISFAEKCHEYSLAQLRTNPLYLAEEKIAEIEALQADTTAKANPIEINQKINLLITQVDALLSFARTQATDQAEMSELDDRFNVIRKENKLATPVNGQGAIILEDEQQKTALAQSLIDEQEEKVKSCKKELPVLGAAAVVMTGVAIVAVIATVAIAATAIVAVAPYLPVIIGLGLLIGTLAVGMVKLGEVLEDKYTKAAREHAKLNGVEALLQTALESKTSNLNSTHAQTYLSEEHKEALMNKQARLQYTRLDYAKDLKEEAGAKISRVASTVSKAFYSFFATETPSSGTVNIPMVPTLIKMPSHTN